MAGHGVNRAKTEGTGVAAGGVTGEAIRWITFVGIIVLNLLPSTFYFLLFTSKGGLWKNMDQNSPDLSIVGFLAFVHGLAQASYR